MECALSLTMKKPISIKLTSSLLIIGILSLSAIATDAQVFALPIPGPPQIKDAPNGFSVCVAIVRRGAPAPILGDVVRFGHIAWGIEISRGQYMFGSLENPSGGSAVNPGQPNGGWVKLGTFNDMKNAFRDPAVRQSNPAHAGLRYDAIKCVAVARPNVGDAQASGRSMACRGYKFPGNTCLDAVDNVLRAYGAPGLPSPTLAPAPNDYYDALRWPRSINL